jgi:hypothetical protein
MASISNAAANLYNYTAPVTGSNVVNDKKTNINASSSSVASAKFAVESTIVSIGNKSADPALTYNATGRLGAIDQTDANKNNSLTSEQAAQNAILQAQTAISDALNGLSGGSTSSSSSDIASLLNIPGVTTARQ